MKVIYIVVWCHTLLFISLINSRTYECDMKSDFYIIQITISVS
jgi:hypothetical protein